MPDFLLSVCTTARVDVRRGEEIGSVKKAADTERKGKTREKRRDHQVLVGDRDVGAGVGTSDDDPSYGIASMAASASLCKVLTHPKRLALVFACRSLLSTHTHRPVWSSLQHWIWWW